LAGGDLSKTKLDGADLTGYLRGETSAAPHEELYWSLRHGQGILRRGNFKLIISKGKKALYNVTTDISEATEISAQHPEILRSMTERWLDSIS